MNTILFPASKHFNNDTTFGNPEQREMLLNSIRTSIVLLEARIKENDIDLVQYIAKARKDCEKYNEILRSWKNQEQTKTYIIGV